AHPDGAEYEDVAGEADRGDGDSGELRVARRLHGLAPPAREAERLQPGVVDVGEIGGDGDPGERENADRHPHRAVAHRLRSWSIGPVNWDGSIVASSAWSGRPLPPSRNDGVPPKPELSNRLDARSRARLTSAELRSRSARS